MSVKVNFKRGSQSSINTLLNGTGNRFTEGTFYLTNDTNRLYFAQAADKLVDLNQYIRIKALASLNDLPNSGTSGYENLQAGDMYYWENQNVLAICKNPQSGTWVQLNPDTKLSASNNAINVSDSSGTVTIAMAVSDTATNSASGNFSIQGGNNVTVSRSGNTITIESQNDNDNTTYTLGTTADATAGVISLTPSTGTKQNITIAAGPGMAVTSNDAGTITIGTASGAQGIKGVSNAFGPNGAFITTLEGVSTDINSEAVTPIIAYGTGYSTTAAFASGTAQLDVYTKGQVDDKIAAELKGFDAMEYAGTVTQATAATKLVATEVAGESPKAGTTYKAASNINNVNGVTAKTGDLIIASGTDGNVEWEVVPSGDEQTITGAAEGNGITISDGAGVIAGIGVNGSSNTYGTISVTPSISSGYNTLTVAHGAAGTGTAITVTAADVNTTQSASKKQVTIPVVTSISKDAAGHVTAVSAQNYVLNDSHANIENVIVGINTAANSSTDSSAGGTATVAITVQDSDNASSTGNFKISSSNLEVTTPALEAGSNTYSVNIDLVWGSF